MGKSEFQTVLANIALAAAVAGGSVLVAYLQKKLEQNEVVADIVKNEIADNINQQ